MEHPFHSQRSESVPETDSVPPPASGERLAAEQTSIPPFAELRLVGGSTADGSTADGSAVARGGSAVDPAASEVDDDPIDATDERISGTVQLGAD